MYQYAQTAQIKGVVLAANDTPLENVSVQVKNKEVKTNANGFYMMEVAANEQLTIHFYLDHYQAVTYQEQLRENQSFELNIRMQEATEQLKELVIDKNLRQRFEGTTIISPDVIRRIPGANAGVENLLKTLPGVYSNNELSTQYAVRGGNYDENLVYVNEIEVYRPFLIRSGQQEGLSFVNSDLTSNVEFSAGGFQAKYGDKLSSVLDITYRKPIEFGARVDLSLLGASATVESASKNGRLSSITGLRYRDNSMFVDAQETETNYRPRFADLQSYWTYRFSTKFELAFLGNVSINDYSYQPLTRQTNFGTVSDPIALLEIGRAHV